jgi:midasin (ATPase involved in ribosome maturation)
MLLECTSSNSGGGPGGETHLWHGIEFAQVAFIALVKEQNDRETGMAFVFEDGTSTHDGRGTINGMQFIANDEEKAMDDLR